MSNIDPEIVEAVARMLWRRGGWKNGDHVSSFIPYAEDAEAVFAELEQRGLVVVAKTSIPVCAYAELEKRRWVPPWFEEYVTVGELPGLPHDHDNDKLYRLLKPEGGDI